MIQTEQKIIKNTAQTAQRYPSSLGDVMTWQKLAQMPTIKLYAGLIPDWQKNKGLIGIRLRPSDPAHIQHSLTEPIPLPDNSVDSFQSEDVFEHIEYQKLPAVINEIYRLLKPNAILRISLPDYNSDIYKSRCVLDSNGRIICDPGGNGGPYDPPHCWFPTIENMTQLLNKTKFAQQGKIQFLHYTNPDGTAVMKPIDYSKGLVIRTPDFDKRAQNPPRPFSIVVDLIKNSNLSPEQKNMQSLQTQKTTNQTNQLIQQSYEAVWDKKLNDPQWLASDGKGRIEHAVNYINSLNLPDAIKLLDAGCGRGTLARMLNRNFHYTGIDISQKALQQASRVYHQTECVDINAQPMPFADNSFDLVTALDIIEHVFDPRYLLHEIYRVLKPGGEVILTTPNILCQGHINRMLRERKFPKTSNDPFPYDGGHLHFFTYRDCAELLTQRNFKNLTPIGTARGQENYEFIESSVWISAKK